MIAMFVSFLRPILLWLTIFETLAAARGWRGFTWLGAKGRWLALPLLALALPRIARTPVRAVLGMALAFVPAAVLQALAASKRNPTLDPLRLLEPGQHSGYRVECIDIAMAEGTMPALHLIPDAATGAAVAVLHGSGCDKTYFAWRLADTFVARGIAALLVDLDGHGENPRWQSYPAMLDDAPAAVGWLRERYARVGLVGVSLGGCLAARAAADGLALDALALLESPPSLEYSAADMRREALALSEPFLFDLLRESTPEFLVNTIYDLVRVQSGPRIRCTIGTVDLIAALDLPGSLPRITTPLLMLYGARDSIVKPSQAEQARRAMPPGGTFVMIPGASHLSLTLAPLTMQTLGDWMQARMNDER